MAFLEKYRRSIVKTITYRVLIIITNGFVVWLFTAELDQTLNIVGWATVVSTVLYFGHERVWNHIHWGKQQIKKA